MTKLAVVHGATSGIGREVAIQLVSKGYHIIGIGKNTEAAATLKSLLGGRFEFIQADLSLVAENQRVVGHIADRVASIDLLVLSAGMLTDQSWLTQEGLEINYATHHLSRVIQAEGMLPLLRKSNQPSLIYISPIGQYKKQAFDFNSLPYQARKGLSTSMRSYTLNDYFFQSFSQRNPDISVIGFNPGPTKGTNLANRQNSASFMKWIKPLFLIIATDVKKVVQALVSKVLLNDKHNGIRFFNHKKDIPAPLFISDTSVVDALTDTNNTVIKSLTVNVNRSVSPK